MYKICLDPGHGGKDSGASGFKLNEKDVALQVAKELKKLLEPDFGVIMTRDSDVYVDFIRERSSISNSANSDIFISIHCNAFNGKAKGFEIYHANGSANGQKLAEKIAKHITSDKRLCEINRGIKTARYNVLVNTKAPAVLIELGFIDNVSDNEKLRNYQKDYAKAIYRGILEYFNIKHHVGGENSSQSKFTPIISPSTASLAQMEKWAREKNNNTEFISLAEIYFNLSKESGVNPVIAFAQMAHETGFLYKVKSSAGLDAGYHNPCGLKVSKGGGDYDKNAHMRFDSWESGIAAHLDHLALYAGAAGYPKENTFDPRHFPYLYGTAKTVEELSGKWAPSKSYHENILKYKKEIENMKADEKNIPSEWAKKEWQKAKDYGLMDGTRPKDLVKREELAAVAVRLYEKLK